MDTQSTQFNLQTNLVGLPAQKRYRRAARYSEAHSGGAMVVMRSGQVVFESYNGIRPERALPLASGTKSFCCAIALLGVQDGILTLDEPVANTLIEWNGDEHKSQITIRQLLNLTSGIRGGEIAEVPSYREAIAEPAIAPPGTHFRYGPIPFQIFGEVMVRKLVAHGITGTPLAYLEARLLQPIGLQYDRWRHQRRDPNLPPSEQNRQPNLSTGAVISAREWAKYGVLLLNRGQWQGQSLLRSDLLNQCFQGTAVNPAYGMTFWLNRAGLNHGGLPMPAIPTASASTVMAIGAGNQLMIVLPEHNLVVVRMRLVEETSPDSQTDGFDGEETSPDSQTDGFDRATFLNLLLTGAP